MNNKDENEIKLLIKEIEKEKNISIDNFNKLRNFSLKGFGKYSNEIQFLILKIFYEILSKKKFFYI